MIAVDLELELGAIWVYLAASPLFALTLTLAAYVAGAWVQRRCSGHALANPVLIAAALIIAVLLATDLDYRRYFDGAQFVHFLLGPATVALSVPLLRNLQAVRGLLPGLALALSAGCLAAAASAMAVAAALGAPWQTVVSMAPKSATAPVAMATAESIGGVPTLTAAVVILTGIFGAVAVPAFLSALGVRDRRVTGFALGLSAHGIGTARAFQIDSQTGAFAGLGMAANALATAILVPLLVLVIG